MKKVAIVTVDFNGHKDTDELLGSAKVLDTKNLELLWLVVDNGSDICVKKTIEKYPGVIWLQTGKNLGFAGGYNRGIKYAKEWGADYILIINNDTLFADKDILKKLINVLDKNPKSGLASPKIYFAPEYEFYKDRYTKKDEGKVIWYAGGSFDWDNIISVHRGIDEVDKGKYDKTEKIGFISGCCVLIKREVLEKVGYLEEKLFAYFEDNDWVTRIERAGFEQWYVGSTYIFHKVSRTAGIGSSWSDYLITRNRMWFGMKYAGLRTKFALWREAVRILFTGRETQKEGITDFMKGVWGWKRSNTPENTEYPLELSIIVVNYRTKDLTLKALSSIFANPPKVKFEVIVINNSSDEKFEGNLHIKIIENHENLGFAKAVNQGIHMALGKYILLLNSDTEVKRESIIKLYRFAEKHKDAGAVSAKLLNPDGSVQGSVFKLPTITGAIKEYWFNRIGEYSKYAPKGIDPIKVEAATMSVFLITPAAIEKVGLINEKYFMYFEDMDYCRAIKNAGLSVYYLPDSEVIHYHGESGKNLVDQENQWRRLIPGSKTYHGVFMHYLIFAVLWFEQRIRRWNNSMHNLF